MTPSHASASREGGGEALTGGMQAWLLSSEITVPGADLVLRGGRQHWYVALSQVAYWTRGVRDPAHVRKSSLHGNREIPGSTVCYPQTVRLRKACGRNLNTYVTGKSDEGVVSMKRANKGAQLGYSSQPPAEFVEKRPSAKGNSLQAAVTGTQRPKTALIA